MGDESVRESTTRQQLLAKLSKAAKAAKAAGEKPATPEQAAEMLRKYFLEPLARTEALLADVVVPRAIASLADVPNPSVPAESQPLWKRATVAGVMARQPGGRPREYDHDAIIRVAEALIRERGVDDYFNRFVGRVRDDCKRLHIKSPQHTQMKEICRPIFDAARAQIVKK